MRVRTLVSRCVLATIAALGGALLAAAPAFAKDPSSGGAATGEVVVATVMGLAGTVLVLGPIIAYRAGRFAPLGRLVDFAGRVSGLPGQAALPLGVLGGALTIAVFGMYWDISLHIDNGRDPGPLANPAHYFILVGLMGVMAAGVLAIAIPKAPTRSSARLSPGWDAPVGGILIAACGAFSLIAFPLDDVWHRIFGQDVTLWSPTHLMLITGASLSIFGGLALYREALEESGEEVPRMALLSLVPLGGALLIGLNTFMAEFDFGVPQFRLDFHPIGLMLASGLGLVAARLVIGPGGALGSAVFFLALRGLLTLLVGPVFGQTVPHLPLYLVEAGAVEVVALLFARAGRPVAESPARFGAVAGVAIGTVGLAAEWGWTHVWAVTAWPSSLFPQGALLGFVMAVAAGTIGGFVGRALTPRGTRLAPAPYWALPLAATVAVGVIVYTLPISSGNGRTSAVLTLKDVRPPPDREVAATITVNPPDAASDARLFNVTSWQGKRRSVIQSLKKVGPGVYRTTEPIPVHGKWKSILRLQKDDEVLGLPIFLPRDTGIPAPETPALAHFSRGFQLDKKNLQREQKKGVSPALTTIAYLAVLALTIALIGSLFWGLRRIRTRLGGPGDTPPTSSPAPATPATPRPAT